MDAYGKQVLCELPHLDNALGIKFYEENRCAVHFFMLLLVSADTKLRRETVSVNFTLEDMLEEGGAYVTFECV